MSLAKHVSSEDLDKRLRDTTLSPAARAALHARSLTEAHVTPFSSRYASQTSIPKYRIPHDGAPSDTVYQMVRNELDLDGRPTLNLASFVTTWMDPNAEALMKAALSKNLVDSDEYPSMTMLHDRVVSMLANLWDAPSSSSSSSSSTFTSSSSPSTAVGTACVGSSEGVHLGGLAMKRTWQQRRRAQGLDTSQPNVIMGANAQVALEKFARYFEVEPRILPVSRRSQYRLDPALVRQNVDENTIGVFLILGSTYTGHYEPVEEVARILDEIEAEKGWNVPIHVDAASGGFIAPFTHAQAGTKWNFQLPRVKSINTSGHKYGLVYPGIGWVVWRDEKYLPEDLVFKLTYLGGEERSFNLNFSRPAAHVVVQYYNLMHLGFTGYREMAENCLSNARLLANALEKTGWFEVLSDVHRPAGEDTLGGDGGDVAGGAGVDAGGEHKSIVQRAEAQAKASLERARAAISTPASSAAFCPGLPVVAFHFNDEFRSQFPHIRQEALSLLLRARLWIVPNYTLPLDEQKTEIMRMVVRETLTVDLIDRLLSDLCSIVESLMNRDEVDLELLKGKGKDDRFPQTGMRKVEWEEDSTPPEGHKGVC